MFNKLEHALATLDKIDNKYSLQRPKYRSWLALTPIDYELEHDNHRRTIIALVPEWSTLSPDAIDSCDTNDLIDEYIDFYGTKPKSDNDLWNGNLEIKVFFQNLDTTSESCETLEDYLGELKDQIDDLMSYYVN